MLEQSREGKGAGGIGVVGIGPFATNSNRKKKMSLEKVKKKNNCTPFHNTVKGFV